jgi:hypothetical protein
MAIDPDVEPILAALEQRMQAQIDALRNTDTEVARHLSNTGDLLNAHHAELVAIKRRLDALEQPTTPTPTGGTWFGYTFSGVGTTLNQAPGIVRDFTGGGSIEVFKITRTLTRGVPLWYSWKPDLLSTAWQANVESNLRTAVPVGSVPLFICVWHEPEGSTDAGGGTVAAKAERWRDAHTFLHGVAKKLRAENRPVYVAPICCDWTFWDTSKGSAVNDWYPQTWTDYDVQGYDVYPRGQTKTGSGMIARLTTTGPNQVAPYDHTIRTDTHKAVRLIAAHAKLCGKPWGSGETGVIDGSVTGADVQYPYTRAQRAQRFREIAADIVALDHPPLLWAWYNDGGCNVTNAPDTASVAAWNDSIATNPPIAQMKESL